MAIEARIAFLPHGAGRTNGAAAVYVGFGAVLSVVRALITHACQRHRVAGAARAIRIGSTVKPRGAGPTKAAAAVHVGFGAVFSVVRALITYACER